MHRIDTDTALPDSTFTEGDPMVPVPATEVSADWLNAVQAELAAVIEGAGIELDKADNAQVLAAILSLITARLPGAATTEAQGLIELATNAEAAALTDAGRAITPAALGSLFAHSRYGNGYQALPGGMMIQWGSYTSGASSAGVVCSFPVAFPCICFAVLCSDLGNSCVTYAAYPLSASQFTLWGKLSGSYYVGSCFIIAIGC